MAEKLLFRHLTIVLGFVAVAAAFFGILFAHSGISIIGGFDLGNKTIALSAALIWIFLGSTLAYNAARPLKRPAGLFVLAILILIAALETIEFVFSVQGGHFFIETLFVSAGTILMGSSSTPISPAAAGLVIAATFALMFLIGGTLRSDKPIRLPDVISVLGLSISLVSITFVLSYAYGNPLLYGTQFIPIAFFSALAAFFTGAAIVTSAGIGAFPARYMIGGSTSARLLRVFVPLVIGIVLIENIALVSLSSRFNIRDAVLLSASLVLFTLVIAFVVSQVSRGLGRALDTAEQELVRKNEELGAMNEELTAIDEELRLTNDNLLLRERQLVQKNDELNELNEELTATQEELRQNIEELTRAEKELRESETRHRRFYESGLVGVIYWNMDGVITGANDKFLAMAGYTREDLAAGRIDWIAMTPPEYRYLDEDSARELKASGVNARPFEKEYFRRDGTRVPIIIAGAMLDDARFNGVAFVLDITERKLDEKKIRESEERYRLVADFTYDWEFLVDPNGELRYISPSADRITGRPVSGEKSLEVLLRKISHPDDLDERLAHLVAEKSGGGVSEMEYRIIRPDGEVRWLHHICQPVYSAEGDFLGTRGSNRDITERKFMEEKLQATLKRFYHILAGMPYGILLVTNEDRVEFANQAFCDFFDLVDSPADLLNLSAHEIIGKIRSSYQDPVAAVARIGEIVRMGEPVRDEDVAMRSGRVFLRDFTPILLGEKRYGRLWIHMDITSRRKAEEELRRKNEDLNALNKELTATQEELHQNIDELSRREHDLNRALAEKEVLLSEIHHRVKNNLTAFISLLSLEGSTEDTPAGKLLKQDLQNRARSMALIHETLYRTNMYDEVDMGIYLTTLVDQIENSFRTTKGVKTVVDAHGVMLDIPRATPAGLIINELVTNSFKYAFPDSFDSAVVRKSPPTITVMFAKDGEEYVLTVSDNGIGLPPGFDLTTTKTLGLKLVNFLAKHQMRAMVEVRANKGTEFIFRMNK